MRRLQRGVSLVLIVCLFFSATGIASAQAQAPPPAQAPSASGSADSMAQGLIDGEMLAEGVGTGGKFATGLGIGVLTGILGTGIGYFVVGPSPLSPEALQRSLNKSADYQLGLKTAWEKKSKSKKRNAFLIGGLLGTAAWITFLAAAQGAE